MSIESTVFRTLGARSAPQMAYKEPMLLAWPTRAVSADDGWTIRTKNGALAVHEEHTIVVRAGAPMVLTSA